jgi:hypothetical protein
VVTRYCTALPRLGCLSRRVDLIWLEAFDSGAYGDAARCEDVGSEAAAVDQVAQYALVGEPLQVSAGLTEPTPDAFDVADPEALTDQGGLLCWPGRIGAPHGVEGSEDYPSSTGRGRPA